MATRSTIALEFADGTVGMIYSHWDGYLEHNGQMLFEHYQDPFKVRELIDLGDVSSLGPSIGEKHSFDSPFKYGTPEYETDMNAKRLVCTFYGRDRGETNINARYFKDFADYEANHQREEYEYILRRDGFWYVSQTYGNNEYVLLGKALEAVNTEETA